MSFDLFSVYLQFIFGRCQAHAIFSAMKFKEIQIYAGKTDFLLEK